MSLNEEIKVKRNYTRQGNINRRRRPGRKGSRLPLWIAFCAILAAAAIVGLILFSGKETDKPAPTLEDTDKLIIMSIEEEGEWVILTTSYGKMRYPFAFSDVIKTEAVNYGEYSQLKLSAAVSEKTVPIYTLNFNHDSGIPAGELVLPVSGEKIGVSVEFFEPDGLTEEEENVFHAACETFNDILDSFAENENFSKLTD